MVMVIRVKVHYIIRKGLSVNRQNMGLYSYIYHHNLLRWILIPIISAVIVFLAPAANAKNIGNALDPQTPFTIYSTRIVPLIMPDMEKHGFLYDLMCEISERVSRIDSRITTMPKIVLRPWNRSFKIVERSSNKLMLPMTRLLAREDKFTWITKVMDIQYAFFSTTNRIDSLEAARSLDKVAVYRNTSHEVFLLKHGFSNLSRSTGELNAAMLERGRVDAWYSSVSEALWLWKTLGLKGTLGVGNIVHSTPLWLVASKDFPFELVPIFQKVLQDIREDGTYLQIYKNYFQ